MQAGFVHSTEQPLGLSLAGSVCVLTLCTGPTQPLLTEFESEFETFSFTEVQTWTGPQKVTILISLFKAKIIYTHTPSQASAYLICSSESPVAGIPQSLFQWLAVCAVGNVFLS